MRLNQIKQMRCSMTYQTVLLRDLLVPKNNPRRSSERAAIVALSESILSDGVLQNLIVSPEKDGKYRIIAGERRFRALQLLRSKRAIETDYPVPVEVREDASEKDKLRLSTVENTQREALNAIDEAEAFAALVQGGTGIEEVAAKTGIPISTVRRRLALSGLCPEAKRQIRLCKLPISVGEAMTLGSAEQQRMLLKAFSHEEGLTAADVRRELVGAKPTLAMALFPPAEYTGPLTRDLFSDADTTYCDDKDMFLSLQRKAVDEFADECRAEWEWVEIIEASSIPSWRYRKAEGDEKGGAVIAFDTSGAVESQAGLIRRSEQAKHPEPKEKVKRERPEFSDRIMRYVSGHKSAAVQVAILANPHTAKALVANLLLSPRLSNGRLRLEPHPCQQQKLASKAIDALKASFAKLSGALSQATQEDEPPATMHTVVSGVEPIALYQTLKGLPSEELDAIVALLLVSCFGLDHQSSLEPEFLNYVASDLEVDMRSVWSPDEEFLLGLSKAQLLEIARDTGATSVISFGRMTHKGQLVSGLVRYFSMADDEANRDDARFAEARKWLPGVMRFPVEQTVCDTKETE
jgi:ParB family chromosome partitioning protein